MPKEYCKKQTISFREKVYKAVKKIPKGKVMTYGQVARVIGSPRAFRAVGNALDSNPDIEHVPCHRVVKSDGNPGGYRYGTKKKLSLLKREEVVIKDRRVVI